MEDVKGRGETRATAETELIPSPVEIDKPRWDQATFLGRLNHFSRVCNPFLLLKPRTEYEHSRQLVEQARYNSNV